jgi:uncharacterized LabA/DUF88 family protein
MSDIQNYVFIDGNYLRRAYEDSMRTFFQDVHHSDLDLSAVKKGVGASKAFYYDAIDERAADADTRKQYLDEIRSLDGFHVRQGTITGEARKKRQKGVDVQLAVECLTHAHNKNVWHVTLVAGDLDFEPLVTALVNVGTHVHVLFERKSAARALYHAADVAYEITLRMFWEWSKTSFRKRHPIPYFDNTRHGSGSRPGDIETIPAQGVWKGRPVWLCTAPASTWMLHFPEHEDESSMTFRFHDRERLEQFFLLEHGGTLDWSRSSVPEGAAQT